MGRSKYVTIGYRYFIGMHMVVSHKIESLMKIYAGDREIFSGDVTSNSEIFIDKPNIFGGEKKEGGVTGYIDVEFGGDLQGQNTYLKDILGQGQPIPAYRGVFGIVLKRCYVTSMTPVIKPWSFVVKSIPRAWYPERAEIAGQGAEGDADYIPTGSCNPAHIIYDQFTNQKYGLGYSAGRMDDDSFRAAADILHAENFGLSFTLAKQLQMKEFITTVLTHINGILAIDQSTGRFNLRVIREPTQAELDAALVLDETNSIISSFETSGMGETINEVVVNYIKQGENRDSTITLQDLASISAQGARISRKAHYQGIDNDEIAKLVGERELRQYGSQLAKMRIKTNRVASSVRAGDIIKVTSSAYGIDEMIVRVFAIDYGSVGAGTIIIDGTQDVFSLPQSTYIINEPEEWTDPVGDAQPVTQQIVREEPYYSIATTRSESETESVKTNDAYVQYYAIRPSGVVSSGFSLWVDVANSGDYRYKSDASYTPTIGIINPIDYLDAVVNVGGFELSIIDVEVGSYAIMGDEYVRIDDIDSVANTITIGRGCLDTYPQQHNGGTLIWFAEGNEAGAADRYVFSDVIDCKAEVVTGVDRLDIDLATPIELTMQARQGMPIGPCNIMINGGYYPLTIQGDISLTWAHRNRLLMTAAVEDFTFAGTTREFNTEIAVSIINDDTQAVLVDIETELTSFAYSVDQEIIDHGNVAENIRVEIKSKHQSAGLESYQTFVYSFKRTVDLDLDQIDLTPNFEL